MRFRHSLYSLALFLTSFLLMTVVVHLGSETDWMTAMFVAGGSSLVAILVPVKRFRFRR